MPPKRRRNEPDDGGAPSRVAKRPRHRAQPDLLSPLSDELLVRILSLLPLPTLLSVAPVSRRFYALSADSQVWRRLYYARFVLPRALRIPGFRDGSSALARAAKLHYSSRRAVWADGRRGGWVEARHQQQDRDGRDWKRQYKLRHNWARGKCAVEELKVGHELPADADPLDAEAAAQRNMLVKVTDGLAVTADVKSGLRAWDLKTKELVAQIRLADANSDAVPSCLAVDDQGLEEKVLDIAVGFSDGSVGIWRLDVDGRRMVRRYRHEKSSNGELVAAALSYPYLLTATKSVLISLYTFEGPVKSNPLHAREDDDSETERGSESETEREWESHTEDETDSGHPAPQKTQPRSPILLKAPYLLTSLKSHTSRAPLALSIRKTPSTTVASIAYTFSTLQGWSLGIQDLHITPSTSRLKQTPDVISSRLAYTLPIVSTSFGSARTPPPTPPRHPALGLSTTGDTSADDGPTTLCYTHPYLLATLPDNTLILHLCTSTASSLSISPGIRLWGHTSGISDAEITARGKAVSVSSRGEEIRVWELETGGRSVEVRPVAKSASAEGGEEDGSRDVGVKMQDAWDDRRNWVGFDDEMVIVLKESRDGDESLLVYDFT